MMDSLLPDQYGTSDIVQLDSVCFFKHLFCPTPTLLQPFPYVLSPIVLKSKYYISLETNFWGCYFIILKK